MKDEYIYRRPKDFEIVKKLEADFKSDLVKIFRQMGCDYCSGNYYDCKDYARNNAK